MNSELWNYGKNLKLTKNNAFDAFVIEFFLAIASHQYLKNILIIFSA